MERYVWQTAIFRSRNIHLRQVEPIGSAGVESVKLLRHIRPQSKAMIRRKHRHHNGRELQALRQRVPLRESRGKAIFTGNGLVVIRLGRPGHALNGNGLGFRFALPGFCLQNIRQNRGNLLAGLQKLGDVLHPNLLRQRSKADDGLLRTVRHATRRLANAQGQVCIFCATHRAVSLDSIRSTKRFAGAGLFRLGRSTLAGGQVCALHAANGAVRIGITLCTEGNTGALLLSAVWRLICIAIVLRIAEGTHKIAGLFCRGRGVATSFVMLVLAVQHLFHTAAFLAAFMGAVARLCFTGFRRGSRIVRHILCWEAVAGMLVGTVRLSDIAVIAVLMVAGRLLRCRGIAALLVVSRVVFTQPAHVLVWIFRRQCIHRQSGKYHRRRQHKSGNPFSLFHVLPPCYKDADREGVLMGYIPSEQGYPCSESILLTLTKF